MLYIIPCSLLFNCVSRQIQCKSLTSVSIYVNVAYCLQCNMPIRAMASHMIFSILFYVCNIICSLYLFLKQMSVLFSSHLFFQFNVENATLFGALLDVIQMLE